MDTTTFALDQALTPEQVKDVIIRSVERLLERDSPSLETMKMQIEYDTSFHKFDHDAHKLLRVRNKMIASHKMAIVEVEMDESNDFEALTTLYRKIFRFLLDFAPNAKSQDRSVEREVAAALESVFPRIGLKAFVQLSIDEKSTQLLELARIVLGIRLFNRDQGRGGVGIESIDKDGSRLSNSLLQELDQEVEYFADACNKYQRAIVRALLRRRRQEISTAAEVKRILRQEEAQKSEDSDDIEESAEKRAGEAKAPSKDGGETVSFPMEHLVSNYLIDRWSQELANRRQYLGFLRALQDEVQNIQEKVSQLCDLVQVELVNLRSLVGNKSSVPKEVVYPRFDSLGSTWIQLFEETTMLSARYSTFQDLIKYRLSFNPTLAERFYTDKPSLSLGDKGERSSVNDSIDDSQDFRFEAQPKTAMDDNDTSSLQILMDSKDGQAKDSDEGIYESGATLLSVQSTADFMLLPLELQGFCPWTIVHARGLLVPGKPNLGVVRFDNMYYVCDHEAGLRAFIQNPQHYLDAIKDRVVKNPEYIHILRMQRWFPNASIAKLMDSQNSDSTILDDSKTGFGGKPATKDASTGTPVHFVERYIDNSYHWNEWELRKRALKVVNLKNCVTTSQQTDNSHFRRDNDTQVYEFRAKDTQTRREKGTNPAIVTTYMAGLRGRAGDKESGAISRYVNESKSATKQKGVGARVVRLELDL